MFSMEPLLKLFDAINNFFLPTPNKQGNILTIHMDTKTKLVYGCLAPLLKPQLYSLTY